MQGDEKAFSGAVSAALAVDGGETSYASSLARSSASLSESVLGAGERAGGAVGSSGVIDDVAPGRGASPAQPAGAVRSTGHMPSGPAARGSSAASGSQTANGSQTESPSVQPTPANQHPNNLSKIRKERMLSKAELARRAGLSVLTVDRIEKGFGCRMDTKRKILEALGLTLSDRVRVFGDEE